MYLSSHNMFLLCLRLELFIWGRFLRAALYMLNVRWSKYQCAFERLMYNSSKHEIQRWGSEEKEILMPAMKGAPPHYWECALEPCRALLGLCTLSSHHKLLGVHREGQATLLGSLTPHIFGSTKREHTHQTYRVHWKGAHQTLLDKLSHNLLCNTIHRTVCNSLHMLKIHCTSVNCFALVTTTPMSMGGIFAPQVKLNFMEVNILRSTELRSFTLHHTLNSYTSYTMGRGLWRK